MFVGDFTSIALYVDARIDGIVLVTWPGQRPHFVGSESAFGSLYAVNIASAYMPDGVLGLRVAMDDGGDDGVR